MKNLMNRVFVALAVSAVFAGNINAAAAPMADNTTASAKIALGRLALKGPKGFAAYSEMNRKKDAAILREQIPSAKSDIAVLEAAVLTKDASKRAEAFGPQGKATHAITAIKLAVLNDGLKDATAQLKANPSEANAAMVAAKQAEASAAVAALDETAAGWNATHVLIGTIGLAAVAYFGSPYAVPALYQAAQKAGEFYGYAQSTKAGQVVGSGLSTAKEWGTAGLSTVRENMPSMSTLYSAMKSYFSNNPAADAQTAAAEAQAADAQKAAAEAQAAANRAAMDAANVESMMVNER